MMYANANLAALLESVTYEDPTDVLDDEPAPSDSGPIVDAPESIAEGPGGCYGDPSGNDDPAPQDPAPEGPDGCWDPDPLGNEDPAPEGPDGCWDPDPLGTGEPAPEGPDGCWETVEGGIPVDSGPQEPYHIDFPAA